MGISYLYNGDVITSVDSHYTEVKNLPLTSPSFIINSIVNIYQESFDIMIKKSKEFIIPFESINKQGNLFDKISELGMKSNYIFCSDKSKKLFGLNNNFASTTSALPAYFYSIDKYIALNIEVFYSPLIKEDDDEMVLYVVDSSIQSLVYAIQNMDYIIEEDDEFKTWKHTMNYNLYDCRFNSYRLSVRNVSRLRNDKINKILNGN